MKYIVPFIVAVSSFFILTYSQGQGQAPSAPLVAPPTRVISKVSLIPRSKFNPAAPSAQLAWFAPAVGCSSGCTYNIYRGATSGSEIKIATGDVNLAYTDTSVVRGNPYCYYVTAQNSVAESGPSNEVCVVIPVPPGAPTGLTVQTN